LRRWRKGKVFAVTKIRVRTAFASGEGAVSPLVHDLRTVGFLAHTSDEDHGPLPPGPPLEILILKIEESGEEVADVVVLLLGAVSDWARVRFYQARDDRARQAPKHVIIRGPEDETLKRVTLKREALAHAA
jgi:hypothetical protein